MMKHLLNDSEFRFNEILFEGRNKNYGAYALRNDANGMLTKAMFVGVSLFATIAAVPLLINAFKATEVVEKPKIFVEGDLSNVDTFEKDPPAAVIPPKAENLTTVESRIPTPVRDSKKETAPATIDESENAIRGFENKKGEDPVIQYVPPVIGSVPGISTVKPVVVDSVKPVNNDPVANPDIDAKFPGGINAFRSKVVQNFDTSDFEGTGDKISTSIVFIVEKDGTVSNIKANGKDTGFNREAEATIKKIKGKWEPAKVNGQPVRSYFTIPISMLFE